MPRIARGLADDQIYHLINRGNRGSDIFHDSDDFSKFLALVKDAKNKFHIKLYSYCLMDNHYHLVIYTKLAKSLSEFMQWLGTSYVRYYNQKYKTQGHLWQGRYKSFIVQKNSYIVQLIRYVESNPLRAGMVKDASLYQYSSAKRSINILVDAPPIELPIRYNEYINDIKDAKSIDDITVCVNKQAPYGEQTWQEKTAIKYGLESTLRSRGRPKKNKDEDKVDK